MKSKSSLVRISAGLALAGVLLVGVSGCGHHAPAAEGSSSADSALAVGVVHPRKQTLARAVEQPAHVEAFEEAPIQVKISGYVEKVHVEIGTLVKKGDLLAELSVPEVKEELQNKTGLVAQAHIDITLAEKTLKVAQANARTAESLVQEARASRKRSDATCERWKLEAAQMKQLVRDNVIASENREVVGQQLKTAEAACEEATAKVESAEAARDESHARREKAEADVSAAKNRLLLAESAQRQAADMLEYARITAPFDGVVSERHVHTGHFVQASSASSARPQPLFTVVRVDKVRVFMEVPETEAVLVKCGPKEGSLAHIRVPVLNDREFTGRVVGSSWSLDASQRTLRTEIDFDNADGALRPGMYAHALIDAQQLDAWVLPSKSFLTRDGQTFCYCVEDGKAVRTPVKVGFHAGRLVAVLKKQVRPEKPGDSPRWVNFMGTESVIAERVGELTDGHEVRVSQVEEAAEEPR